MADMDYLQLMEESLEKKIKILQEIQKCNENQYIVLKDSKAELEQWQQIVARKSEQIDLLNQVDQGFDCLYERIREELNNNKEKHQTQIHHLQQLISSITDLSVSIQSEEARNKQLAEAQFAVYRRKGYQIKQNYKVSNAYQSQMKKLNVIEAQFLDQKK